MDGYCTNKNNNVRKTWLWRSAWIQYAIKIMSVKIIVIVMIMISLVRWHSSQWERGGAMREPFSQSENTAGERRHSHILEANRTWEPAYFLFFISTNRVLHPWESCRSLCRRNTGFDTRLSFGDAQWAAGVLWRDFSKKDNGAQSEDSQYQRSKWFEGYLNWIFTIMFG